MNDKEFYMAHGHECVSYNEVRYFFDGATEVVDGAARGDARFLQREPPKDPLARATNILIFYTVMRDGVRGDFMKLKNRLKRQLQSAAMGPHSVPSEEQITELEELQKKVKTLDQEWQKANDKVERLTPNRKPSRDVQRARTIQEQQVARANERINAIEI